MSRNFSLGSKNVDNNDVTIIDSMEDGYVSTDITNEKSDDGYLASSRGYFLATSFFLVVVIMGAVAKLNGYLVCKDPVAGTLCVQSDCDLGYDAIFKIRGDCKDQEAGSLSGQSDCELGFVAGFKTRDD